MANDPTMIDDVRAAKRWVDSQAEDFSQLKARLKATQDAYLARSGSFASVPLTTPPAVRQMINQAPDAPGDALLTEHRQVRAAK
jgi:hypothetical protein